MAAVKGNFSPGKAFFSGTFCTLGIAFVLWVIAGAATESGHTLRTFTLCFSPIYFLAGIILAVETANESRKWYSEVKEAQCIYGILVSFISALVIAFLLMAPAPGTLEERNVLLREQLKDSTAQLAESEKFWKVRAAVAERKLDLLKGEGSDENMVASCAALSPLDKAKESLRKILSEDNEKIIPVLRKLYERRDEAKKRLLDSGINSSEDLRGNQQAQLLAGELAEIVSYVNVMEKKRQSYRNAEFSLEVMIRRLELRNVVAKAGLTDEEMNEIEITLKTINAGLEKETQVARQLSPTEIDGLVDEALLNVKTPFE